MSKWPLVSVIVALCRLQELTSLQQIVVDDANAVPEQRANRVPAWLSYSWRAGGGGRLACGREGWKETFLFLDPEFVSSGSSDGADVSVTFTFDPPSDGCYLIEEFHPRAGLCMNSERQMLPEAHWTIHHSKSSVKDIWWRWDDDTEGNRWNVVEMLPFYKGYEGRIIVKHPCADLYRESTPCPAYAGWIPADAFRFTRIDEAHWCASSAIPQDLKRYQRLSLVPLSVVLDDKHSKASGGSSIEKQCGEAGVYGGVYVADKNDSLATYVFEPPSMGCYRVEEYHPSFARECSVLLTCASVEVQQWQNMTWESPVDLTRSSNQWNIVGHFLFLAGSIGIVTSRPLNTSPVPGSVWIADAFRFTKVSETCNLLPYSALVTFHIHGADVDDSQNHWSEAHGLLHLELDMALKEFFTTPQNEGLEPLYRSAVHLLFFRRHGRALVIEFELRGQTTLDKQLIQRHIEVLHAEITGHPDSSFSGVLCGLFARKPKSHCNVEVVRSSFEQPRSDAPYKAFTSGESPFSGSLPSTAIFLMSIFPAGMFGVCLLYLRRCKPRRARKEDGDALERGVGEQELLSRFADARLELIREEEEFRESDNSVKRKLDFPADPPPSSMPLLDEVTSVISTNTPGSGRASSAQLKRIVDSRAAHNDGTSSASDSSLDCRGIPQHVEQRETLVQDDATSTSSGYTPISSMQCRREDDLYPVFEEEGLRFECKDLQVDARRPSVKADEQEGLDIATESSEDDGSTGTEASDGSEISASRSAGLVDSEIAGGEGLAGGNADPGMYRYPVAKVVDKE